MPTPIPSSSSSTPSTTGIPHNTTPTHQLNQLWTEWNRQQSEWNRRTVHQQQWIDWKSRGTQNGVGGSMEDAQVAGTEWTIEMPIKVPIKAQVPVEVKVTSNKNPLVPYFRQLEDKEKERIAKELEERQQHQLNILKDTLQVAYERELEEQRRKKQEQEQLDQQRREREEQQRREEQAQREKEELEQRRVQEEEKKKRAVVEEEERRRRMAEQERVEKELAVKERVEVDEPPQALADAQPFLDHLDHLKHTLNTQVKANRAMLLESLRYRMQFTTKCGAITPSLAHLRTFIQDLSTLLDQGRASSPVLYTWLVGNLGKQMVKQAQTEVAANTKKAFPLAMLAVGVTMRHPELRGAILGRVYKRCPFLIPVYYHRREGESDEALRKRWGHKPGENEEQFHERMNGIAAFFAALTLADPNEVFPGSLPSPKDHPYPLARLWTLLARLLNRQPRKVTPGLVETLLHVAGHTLLARYGVQMHKLMRYLAGVWVQRVSGEAARVRLEVVLGAYARTGTLAPHEGRVLNR